jgi:hypothetical protein
MKNELNTTATGAKLHVFTYTATFLGGGIAALVGGNGADELEAMADAAAKLHALGYRDVVLAPRKVS